MYKCSLHSLEDTEKFGFRLGKILKGGDLLCFIGDLGAGKTTLTKSIAKGLDVKDYVTSPTFTLINEYQGRVPLYHFDVYRLDDVDSLYDLGFEEYFYSNGVCIIEWGDKILSLLPKDTIILEINRGNGDNDREVTITGQGDRYTEIVEELNKN